MHRKAINILTTVLRYSGYWPLTSSATPIFKVFNFILRYINFGVFLCLAAAMIGDAMANFNDLSLITDNLCFSIGILQAVTRAFRFYNAYDNIIQLIEDVYEPLDKLQDMGNVEVTTQLHNLAQFELKQISYLSGLIFLVVITRIFGAETENKEFPIRVFFPFEYDTPPRYQLLYIVISYGVICVDLILFVVDTMIVVIMRYLTFQLKLLLANCRHCHVESIKSTSGDLSSVLKDKDYSNEKEDIQNFTILEFDNKDINKMNTFDWRFKQCIIHHQKILKMITVLNDNFSFIAAVQIIGSSILLCFNGFQILSGNDDSHLIVRRVIVVVVVLLQMLMWCWYGNKLSTEADALTYHQWMCGWESESKRGVRNSVTTSMILSLQSLELRAMGLIPLSLQTFVSTIKKSYSVLVLLLAVADD